MLTFAGVYLLVIASDPHEIGLRAMPSMATCQQERTTNPLFREPRFRRIECLDGVALLSESLVGVTVDRLRHTLESIQPYR